MHIKQAEHKCEGVGGWDEIYADHDGDWIFSADAGDSHTTINFCPFCGLRLEKLDALPKPEKNPRTTPAISLADFDKAVKATRESNATEILNSESSFHKLFK